MKLVNWIGVFLLLAKGLSANIYNVQTYGPNGSHLDLVPDTTAINSAISDAVATGGTVYFPSGTYIVDAKLITITGTCKIKGDGVNGSIVRLISASDLLEFNVNTASPTLTIEDITFETINTGSGTALNVNYSSSSPATTGLSTNRFSIKDAGGGTWTKGIRLNYAKNSTILNTVVTSNLANFVPQGSNGISIEGDSSGVVIKSSQLNFWKTGVAVSASITAITMEMVIMIAVERGVYASSSVGTLQFLNGHIDARSTASTSRCIQFTGGSNAVIKNSLLFVASNEGEGPSGSSRYNIEFDGTGTVIDGNQLLGFGRAGGIVVNSGSSQTKIRENHLQNIGASNRPIEIKSGASATTIENNSFSNFSSPAVQPNGTSTTITNNKEV